MRLLKILVLFLVAIYSTQADAKEARIALVIGNNHYSSGLHQLDNAVHDAILISKLLREAGFDVVERHDLNDEETHSEIKRLGERLKTAGPEAVGLFYFAGHGFQVADTNYLMPVDAPVNIPDDIAEFGLNSRSVLDVMIDAGTGTNIIILDACRGNRVAENLKPVAARGMSVEQEADEVEEQSSVFFAYSTGKGQYAYDGEGENSPYASTLAQFMLTHELPLEILFRNVRVSMVQQGYQKPWDSSGMLRAFSFIGEPRDIILQPAVQIERGSVIQINDFGKVPAKLGLDNYVPAGRYLRQGVFPVTVKDVIPQSSEIAFFNTERLYEGRAVRPSISSNVLTQIDTGNVAAGFTLVFPEPVARVRFLIPRLFAATESGITFPAWKATALSENGEIVDSVEDEMVRSFGDVPEKYFEVRSDQGSGITALRFESDPRLNGIPFTAFSAVLIEGIWIEAMR